MNNCLRVMTELYTTERLFDIEGVEITFPGIVSDLPFMSIHAPISSAATRVTFLFCSSTT